MASTDKTRQQLVDSMRKTKQGSPAAPAARKKTATAAGKKPATAAKRSRTAAKPAARKKAVARGEGVRSLPSNDGYQSGRRVWPD